MRPTAMPVDVDVDVDWDSDDVPLGELLLTSLRENAEVFREVPAQIDSQDGRALSFDELLAFSVRAAAAWRALGLRRGDHLGVYAWNRHEVFPAILGAIFEGITVVLVVPFASGGELSGLLSTVPLGALLTEDRLLKAAVAEASPTTTIVVVGQVHGVRDTARVARDVKTLDELLERGDAQGLEPRTYRTAAIPDVRRHVVAVTFSSGTSGLPKGVMLSDQGLRRNVEDKNEVWRDLPGERVVVAHPLSWATGLITASVNLIIGSTTVLLNYVDERHLLDVMVKYKVSSSLSAPPRLMLLAQLVAERREEHGVDAVPAYLRCIKTVGSALTADCQRKIIEALGVPVLQFYGTTEAGTITGYPIPKPGRPVIPTPGATGKTLTGVQLRIVDLNSGEDVAEPGRPGEVRVRSPFMMLGYVDNPQAQADAFDERGYYRTGDVAYLDERGELYIVDRIKEMITFDEFDVAPAQIEEVLSSHPAVREACVVGRKHPRLDELPTAFVVRKEGTAAAAVTAQELQDLVKGRLADYKRLRGGVFFVAEIPKSTYGKVQRLRVREMLDRLPAVSDDDLL